MKQSLQIKLNQTLAMTPQLQQAIRLLQLSTLELQTEVQEALETNLMLEVDEGQDLGPSSTDELNGTRQEVNESSTSAEDVESPSLPDEIPTDLPIDSKWDDVYDPPVASHSSGGDGASIDFESQNSATPTLRDHLLEQLNLLRLTDADRVIGQALIDSVAEDGYLGVDVAEVAESFNSPELEVLGDEVEAVLRQIQHMDPPGVGARDLRECLLIQLDQLPADTPFRQEASTLVGEHLNQLASRDYNALLRSLRLDSKQTLQSIIELVQSLNPRPGDAVQSSPPEYITPDVYVRKYKGAWRVELNAEAMPKLRVNAQYEGLIRRADNSADNSALKSHLQEAKWFIKSLQSRGETLLKVATCIVERQQQFLEHGEEAMKPMVLQDVAKIVDMHESTISRVTTRKYMHTPRGIYELKFFFSSHVFTKSGAECSSTAIRALLKKMIAAENPQKPLSDSKLASILSDQGIKVARRTVAKYREAMSIPASSDRKSLM